jgi:hypothetical protein
MCQVGIKSCLRGFERIMSGSTGRGLPMKRTFLSLFVIASLVVMSVPAVAVAAAPESTSRVIPLGFAVHQGRLVEGYAFVHGRDAAVKPAKPPTKVDPLLYTFLVRGAKWRTTEPYVVNPANADGVAPELVSAALGAATATWEAQVTADVFGAGSVTSAALASDWDAPDGVNEAYFSQTELDSGTVAVTIVWGIFSGALNAREIIEWDMVFNDALPEPWGDAALEGAVWDVENIATHELGHSAGLGDLYTTGAAEQTMFGYASPGEIKKRTLESGDITGIKALYE